MLARSLSKLTSVALSSSGYVAPAAVPAAFNTARVALFSSSSALEQKAGGAAKPKEKAAKKPAAGAAADGPRAKGPSTVQRPEDAPKDAIFKKNPASKSAARAAGAGPEAANWLKDENIEEAYRNLLMLADYKKEHPPKIGALVRVLRHVKTKEDVAVATKALNMCLTRNMQLNSRVANLFTEGCLKAGEIDAAIERFRDPAKYRLFLNTTSAVSLLRAIGNARDAEQLKKMVAVLKVAGRTMGAESTTRFRYETGWRLARAYAKCGDFQAALAAWDAVNTEAPERVKKTPFPASAVLSELGADADAVAANVSKLDAPSKAVLTDKLLPMARGLDMFKDTVARIEAGIAKANAAPAAEAPAADAAPAAEAPAVPAAEAPKA